MPLFQIEHFKPWNPILDFLGRVVGIWLASLILGSQQDLASILNRTKRYKFQFINLFHKDFILTSITYCGNQLREHE